MNWPAPFLFARVDLHRSRHRLKGGSGVDSEIVLIKSVYTHHIDLFASLKVSRGFIGYNINLSYIENRLSREDVGQATPYIYMLYFRQNETDNQRWVYFNTRFHFQS